MIRCPFSIVFISVTDLLLNMNAAVQCSACLFKKGNFCFVNVLCLLVPASSEEYFTEFLGLLVSSSIFSFPSFSALLV